MNKLLFIFGFLLTFGNSIYSQVSTQNYICTRVMLNESGSSYMDEIVYYDGLGRPFQTVQKGITPSHQNMVSLQEYDEAGRKDKSWLPVISISDYVSPANVISSAPGNYNNDSRPYHQSIYESSPLNRIIQQYGPGVDWYSRHPMAIEYLVNTTASPLHCINYTVNSSGGLVNNGNYASAQLCITKVIDEDSNISYTFIDKFERTVLTRQMKNKTTHDTYYVYNDYGNLCFVLQPMYQENSNLSLYAFQYKYDDRNRCIEKITPGADAIKYVYDFADHLVFSQDGNQRVATQWTFYLYDQFHRLTVKGICSNTNTSSASSSVITCTRTNSNTGLGNSGYTSSFGLTFPVVHQVNYYDVYDFRSLTGFTNATYFPVASISAKGYLTGSVTTILENGVKLYSANYYDIRGRVTKYVSSNHLGGYETTNTTYTFTGRPLTIQHIHTINNNGVQSGNLTELYTYTYDHAERVTKTQHALNGKTVTLVTNTYDDWGRLLTKSPHGSSTDKLTYEYNLRDWLTGIKSSKFSQNLYYNKGNGTVCYNGNISSMIWKCGTESVTRGYKFTYDGLNRLKSAVYGEGTTISDNTGRFSENITEYDRNGNIASCQRYGKASSTAYGIIDNLIIAYNGNQLKYANDAAADPLYNGVFNFVNGSNSTGNEYVFDKNGNLQQDYNKKVAKVQYNQLNLPSVLQFINGNRVDYLYDADGIKRLVTHKIAIANISVPMGQIKDLTNSQISQTQTTDYCGNVIYENRILSKIQTEEGYITLNGNSPTYHYYLKDHQGNNRIVINQTGAIEQINHYYPFGGVFEVNTSTSGIQPYKYNGKELDRMHGLDYYDYSARMYDATLGRFTTVDPMVEKYYSMSPYAYCANNPVNFIDLDGRAWRPTFDMDHNGTRTYNGYEWIPNEQSYDKNGNLLAGLYSQAIFFSDNGTFDTSSNYNIGSSTATVYLANGTTTTFNAMTNPSDPDIFATVPENIYQAKVGTHNGSTSSYTALKMRDINATSQTIELGTTNPAYSDGRTYSIGIDIHKAGRNNYTGTYKNSKNETRGISEGCLLIDINNWTNFIENFNNNAQKSNTISVTVSRNMTTPVNVNRLPAFNFFMNGTRHSFFNPLKW